ncbi:MAG TPA: CBS domain-containing protein [Burkholderiales bacterium]|nr:CBS domain-containing protein [Burkholderiales bacterium]
MFGMPIRCVLEPRELVMAPPETSVADAASLMKRGNVGAILIVREGKLLGIFTERDAVRRVLAVYRDPRVTKLAEVMTPDPKTVEPDETFGYALLLMHENSFRHAPVVENGRPIGVVSSRSALDPDLEEFTAEAERRKSIRRRA